MKQINKHIKTFFDNLHSKGKIKNPSRMCNVIVMANTSKGILLKSEEIDDDIKFLHHEMDLIWWPYGNKLDGYTYKTTEKGSAIVLGRNFNQILKDVK